MDALLGILGTTALQIDGEIKDAWGKPRERAVLATLAVHVNRVVSINMLIRWAWPADTPVPMNPAETFHTYAARIRKALRLLPIPADLRAGQGGYRLEMDKSLIDYSQFRELVARARTHAATHAPDQAIKMIEKALALFRGSPLADLSSPDAETWRSGVLQNQLLTANTTLIEQLVSTRRYDEAITRLDDLHADYPDDVTLATLRMTALYGERRGTHGVAFYFAARQRFKNNGDDQAAEHLRLHHEALRTQQADAHRPTPATTPRQLPPDRQGFVGRGELLDRLDTTTTVASGETPSGVVIVDGAGGVGKTALVVRWAHRRRHLFPDGDLFCNMQGYANRATVEHTAVVDDFLMALGQTPPPSLPPRARGQLLSTLLTDRKTLVVLDNVRDTDHVRDLVPFLGNSLVIITSRQWLTSLSAETGAQRLLVPPMNAAESSELLTTRLGPASTLAEQHRADLTELCGGLPLLLTVLAGDLAGKSGAGVREYVEGLDRRQLVVGFDDRGDGPTNGVACFDPSYHALAPADRRLFRLLTLHPGPTFGLDAACACGGQPAAETMRSLARLTGAHLVEEADSLNRYQFHDVLAEYAAYCRDRDEPPDAQRAATQRVLDYYVSSATNACHAVHRSYNPPPQTFPPATPTMTFEDANDALLWFNRNRTNLVSAITYAAEHEYHDHVWRLADPVTTFFDRGGCTIDSREVRSITLRSARAMGNREAEASMLSGLAMGHMTLGDMAEAHRCLTVALRLAVEDGLARGQASVLHQLGRLALRQGDMAQALDLFNRGLAIDQPNGNQEGMCWAHCRIGQALHAIDQHQQALAHLQRASWLAREVGETSAEAMSLREIGAIHYELGNLTTAISHCEQALAVAEAVPDLPATAEICVVLCEINSALHRSQLAIGFGRRAVNACEKTRDLVQHAHALDILGNAQHACGDLVDSVVAWRQAADLYDHTGDAPSAARLRSKIDAVPVFYQEIVPIARSARETGDAAPRLWLSEEERTLPLGPAENRSTSD